MRRGTGTSGSVILKVTFFGDVFNVGDTLWDCVAVTFTASVLVIKGFTGSIRRFVSTKRSRFASFLELLSFGCCFFCSKL